MKVIFDISQEMFKAMQTYYSDNTTRLSIKSCIEKIANGTPIPEGATNGDVIKTMFPNIEANEIKTNTGGYIEVKYLDTTDECDATAFRKNWWNAPYKRGD